jgi:peptidyl-tRNA hydrolase
MNNNTTIHDGALYIITRADLTPGQQSAQIAHAVADFCIKQPEHAAKWHAENEYMICLEAPTQTELALLARRVNHDLGENAAIVYREPDMDNAITAIALTPSPLSRSLTANLPLAGRRAQVKLAIFQIMEELQELGATLSFEAGDTMIDYEGNNGLLYISVNDRRFSISYLPYHELSYLPREQWTDESSITRKGRTTELLGAWYEMKEELLRRLNAPTYKPEKPLVAASAA